MSAKGRELSLYSLLSRAINSHGLLLLVDPD
jgi:hypothetical protein